MLIILLLLAQPVQPMQPGGEVLTSRLTGDVWQIWLRDLATGADEQITSTPGDKRYPGWTADGEIYYHTVNQECFVVRAREGEEPEHVPVLREVWPVRDVTWAPDGRVAFSRIRTDLIDAANLCVAPRGGAATWLTQDPGIQYTPSWSPDGERLAFVSGDGWGTYEVETIRADGTDRRKLTENGSHEFLPAWSPDGASIAFVSDQSGNYEIWTMAADGTDPRRVTDHPALDTTPCWSPDGRTLVYTSSRGGPVQVWSSPVEGGPAVPLIEVPGGARDPAWRARPIRMAEQPGAPPELSEVGVAPKTLARGQDASVELRFRLSGVAGVRADVVDEHGAIARSLAAGVLGPGIHVIAWDGADSDGSPVPDGIYRYVLVAENGAGRAVHDPSTEPWGEEMQPVDFTFDEETGRLRWIQPRAGFARLRAAVSGFPLLETVLDWEPLEGGEQVLDWDGFAASGAVQLAGNPACWITLELFSMPRNTVLAEGGADRGTAQSAAPAYAPLVAAGPQAHLEARKPRRDALAPPLTMEFPSAEALDAEGRPIVSGLVPVRVAIDAEHAASMTNALFEVAFYVDLTFFFEDEESTTPMTWLWDTSSLTPGPHLLTVNVFSYDGRIGCLTRSVVVESVQ